MEENSVYVPANLQLTVIIFLLAWIVVLMNGGVKNNTLTVGRILHTAMNNIQMTEEAKANKR